MARDWERLADFYERVFGCVPVPPARELSGDWLGRGTGVRSAALCGIHLRLPGHGDRGPTLEIFQWLDGEDAPAAAANRRGYGHLAFEVGDVSRALAAVLAAGGGRLGDVVAHDVPGVGELTFVYATDPEGNILELQTWRRERADDAAGLSVEEGYARWAETYDTMPNPTRDLDAQVLPLLVPDPAGLDVLELGCGTGKNTGALLAAASVLSVDLSAEMLAIAEARHHADNLTFLTHDIREPLPLEDASFDLITFDLVLEHVHDTRATVAEAARVLRPSGRLVLVELHPWRQLLGRQARFVEASGHEIPVEAYTHTTAELTGAGLAAGLILEHLGEWPAPGAAPGTPPRLLSLGFRAPEAEP